MKAANLFNLMLSKGRLRCIGATTPDEYRKFLETDVFESQFEQVYVVEPSIEDTISILRGLKKKFEGLHGVSIQDQAFVVAAQLSAQHITDRRLPEKAIDLVDEACVNMTLELHRNKETIDERCTLKQKLKKLLFPLRAGERSNGLTGGARVEVDANIQENLALGTVGQEQIVAVASRRTSIPVTRLGQEEKQRLRTLADKLRQRVVGQDHAVNVVARTAIKSRVGLGLPQQPTGSFLFLGPDGAGKTEIAKALAEQLFDNETMLIRIDMSRTFGYADWGKLVEEARWRPYGVVPFHKVEKAHSPAFSSLLQVLVEGRLTDSEGRTVDLTNTVIIMTSNLGTERLSEGLAGEWTAESAREKVRKHFEPKLLDELDEIVVFDPKELIVPESFRT
ncbi:hypothetical protein RHMOL_Rhmol12G0174200 [Rhododendron molle]|uniref:Uncharacterized protein n=1 Tax=Rhododendron molle TaxID=49168 RepID=A0ACC0LJS7_RHOML|nr:hypothetical protein RHMOL_Rhmol12G0174200 [Rhododendron molle]